jgi:PBP1b-binding outer membrane lipoprotein LpoB
MRYVTSRNEEKSNIKESKMKKFTILFTILTIIGLLAACGSSANQQEPSTVPDANQDGTPPGGFEFEVPLQTALIVGTFKLEGTENAITPEQAANLLPLWMVLKNLLESDTTSSAEIEALTNQISDTMTEAQMYQINTMELTGETMSMLMEELGLNEDFQRRETAEGAQEGGNRNGGLPGGTGPGGGPPGGAGTTGLSAEELEALQATRDARKGGSFMFNTALIEALIELLQSK